MKKPYYNLKERKMLLYCNDSEIVFNMKRKLVKLKQWRKFIRFLIKINPYKEL